jgi:cbb3-type cytochrome oxidase subunit 3
VLMGSYQTSRDWLDLLSLVVLGVFGWFMKRYGWPRPALFVGYILGGSGERNLYTTVEVFGSKWFYDPGVIVIAMILVATLYYSFRKKKTDGVEPKAIKARAEWKWSRSALFSIFLVAFFLFFGAVGTTYIYNAWIYPVFSACIGLICSLIQMVRELRGGGKLLSSGFDIQSDRSVPDAVIYWKGAQFMGWLIGLYLLTGLIGFKLAIPVYFILFLHREANARWLTILFSSGIMFIVLNVFEELLGIYWPSNLLHSLIQLPYLN